MGTHAISTMVDAVLVAAPLCALAVGLLSWLRARNKANPARAVGKSLLDVATVASTAPILAVTLAIGAGAHTEVSLVPFADMFGSQALSTTWLYQNLGNMALFAPLGALAPLAFAQRLAAWWRVGAVAMGLSVTIETCQYLMQIGRAVSVDDVLLNTAGALVGAACTWP